MIIIIIKCYYVYYYC